MSLFKRKKKPEVVGWTRSDTMPSAGGPYLLTIRHNDTGTRSIIIGYYIGENSWVCAQENVLPLAWMPLPDIYKEKIDG